MADTSTISVRLIPQLQYATPTAGQTVTVNSNGYVKLLIDPAGTLATLTIAFPASPQDGDIVEIACSQIVTALTMSGGTFVSALAALAVGGSGTYVYSATTVKWHKFGS